MSDPTRYTNFQLDKPPAVGTSEHALWLVHWHFEWENPRQVDMLATLYTDDIVWELPSAGISFTGKQSTLDNYRQTFAMLGELRFDLIERYATPTRVFDDRWAYFIVTDIAAFPMPNLTIKEGVPVKMRLVHNFHVRDGLISRENVFQMIPPQGV